MTHDEAILKRFPLITEAGHRRLHWLMEHPQAPRYTHPGYNRVTVEGLRRAQAFANEIRASPPRWRYRQVPAWLNEFAEWCFREVPFYRRYGDKPQNFFDLPTTDRSDLNRDSWSFVSDSQPLDDLIVYNTSGATGHPLDILTHPDTLALYIPLLQAALAAPGIAIEGDPERVTIAYVCCQKFTYTYAAVMPVLDQAGFVKINLNPGEWRDSADRAQFLDTCNPQIYTGTPFAFMELADLSLKTRPKALISTSMMLLPGLKRSLESHFGCPILDVYSLNESGPVAVADADGNYLLLQPRLYVEILGEDGSPCEPGQRGEVTLSGGFNPFLPLLRYRTGDQAALEFRGAPGRHAGSPLLVGLEGRLPIVFRARDGGAVNNIDISIALRPLPITQFNLHQFADGSLRLRLRGAADQNEARRAVLNLFGPGQPLTIETLALDGKVVQYTSDLLKQ